MQFWQIDPADREIVSMLLSFDRGVRRISFHRRRLGWARHVPHQLRLVRSHPYSAAGWVSSRAWRAAAAVEASPSPAIWTVGEREFNAVLVEGLFIIG